MSSVFIRDEESDFASGTYIKERRQWSGGIRVLSPAALEAGRGGAQSPALHLGRKYVHTHLSHTCMKDILVHWEVILLGWNIPERCETINLFCSCSFQNYTVPSGEGSPLLSLPRMHRDRRQRTSALLVYNSSTSVNMF